MTEALDLAIGARRREHQRRVQEDARHERARHLRRNRRDAHVDAPFGEMLERVGRVAGLELDVDVGVALSKAR